jgi:hypothetical protein
LKPNRVLFLAIATFFTATSMARPEKIYCGFSESAAWPTQNIILENPGYNGIEIVHRSTYGDDVFVFLTTMENIPNAEQTDMTLLIQTSQAGGFIEASARGLSESPQKWNGVATQTPLNRKDGGLYFVRVSCGI